MDTTQIMWWSVFVYASVAIMLPMVPGPIGMLMLPFVLMRRQS